MKTEIQAVCHDDKVLVNGTLSEVTDTGCELVSYSNDAAPPFPRKAIVMLNILNEVTGESMSIQARLVQALRREGAWFYRLRWKEKPELLAG
jgi:hypothetical protein